MFTQNQYDVYIVVFLAALAWMFAHLCVSLHTLCQHLVNIQYKAYESPQYAYL